MRLTGYIREIGHRERIAILRDVGYDDNDIRRIVWMNVGNSLSRLGRHQDSNLIGGAE